MQMNTTGSGAMTWPSTKHSYNSALPAAEQAAAAKGTAKGASAAGLVEGVSKDTGLAKEVDSADGTEDRFLKLLVAQMRNQDPLNPMDNAQVTSQLAQISTVRGIESLNKTMGDFVTANTQSAAMASVGMLGKQVLVEGKSFNYLPAAGGGARLGFELAAAATAARVEIVDAAGNVVHTRTMGSTAAGMQTFEWDGKNTKGAAVAAGPLAVRVAASDGKAAVEATALVPARVIGIGQAAGSTRLELDGAAPVAPSAVRVIL